MPTPDELSKIDLSNAYFQVELDGESRKYMVVNTLDGLKQFNRMPNGIKPASGNFQRKRESVVRNVNRTVVERVFNI